MTAIFIILAVFVVFLVFVFVVLGKKRVFSQEEITKNQELKMTGLESILGKSHEFVGHAVVPFQSGGTVDMYYFPNGIKGTGFATMQLLNPDGNGPVPNALGTYELVAFTKLDYKLDFGEIPADATHEYFSEKHAEMLETNPFYVIERRICEILTGIAHYSFSAKLEPLQTGELPTADGNSMCLIFDEYKPDGKEFKIGEREYGLLLVMEVHREEMEFAKENGTEKLIEKLKEAGHYPYSDLDRKSVV